VNDAESGTEHEVRRAVASWKSQSTRHLTQFCFEFIKTQAKAPEASVITSKPANEAAPRT